MENHGRLWRLSGLGLPHQILAQLSAPFSPSFTELNAVLCLSDGACLELVVCIVILCFLFIMNTIYNALCDVALLLFIMHIIQKSLRDVALLLLIYTSPCPPSQPLPNLHFYY